MSDREIDQQLVERAQRGDKHAFELLVAKYQRKLIRLLSWVRYRLNIFHYPYELKAVMKYWLRYRQPEIQGM